MNERSPAPALDRGLRLLAELADHPDGLRFTDLVERFGLAKPVCSRLLRVLQAHGYVQKSPGDGRWYLSQHAPIRGIRQGLEDCEAAGVLPDLAEQTGCTALIVARDGAGMRTVAKHIVPRGRDAPKMRPIGSIRYTFLDHPWGRCVLLAATQREYGRILRHERPDEQQLQRLNRARRSLGRRGWCWDQPQDVVRLASPITDGRGRCLAALAIGGRAPALDGSTRERHGRLLRLIATDLGRRL